MKALSLVLVLCAGALASVEPAAIEPAAVEPASEPATTIRALGCNRRSFRGKCEVFDCELGACCELPWFFQLSLGSVVSTGSHRFRLFTPNACQEGHGCIARDDNSSSVLVDFKGKRSLGIPGLKRSFACIKGPY